MTRMRIGILASGGGSNLQAILDHLAALGETRHGDVVVVASNRPDAGALARAERAGIAHVVLRSPHAVDGADLAATLDAHAVELVALAGYMRHVPPEITAAYRGRMLNVHPALLPEFGGPGMYGPRVHRAVIEAGATLSGPSVHFVDDVYDHGALIAQWPVPVLAGDDEHTLAARVLRAEHLLYPRMVNAVAGGQVRLDDDGRVEGSLLRTTRLPTMDPSQDDATLAASLDRMLGLPSAVHQLVPHTSAPPHSALMPRALLSVSDKSGLLDLARGLHERGWELVSTGGTARTLREARVPVRDVAEVTQFPEMLDGRVKTLHPAVHGGLLARRDVPEHMAAIAEHGIAPIDLVVVNLYPFRQTASRPDVPPEEVIEQIDIGGPSMLRSAAKNFASVTTVVDPADYPAVLAAIAAGDDDLDFRRRLAGKVFEHTAAYDSAIAGWFAGQRQERFPERLCLPLERAQGLRYGENPGQSAAFYVERTGGGLAGLTQKGGKELSFNNLLDLEGALLATDPFAGEACCAIIKHTTPCGLAIGADALDAYRKALACDPVSAFGSVISFTVPVDEAAAEAVSSLFVECVVAPSFSDAAIDILGRKKNLRVLEGVARWPNGALDYKRVRGGLLVQDRPPTSIDDSAWRVVTKREPTPEERRDLLFAWRAVASVKSNAIVLARDGATIGIGAGQMSRVDAAFLAVHKATLAGHSTAGAALGSDAFFPFRDGVDQAVEAGVAAIVQPGGSVRDAEVIAAADEHGIAMVFTGVRLFRH